MSIANSLKMHEILEGTFINHIRFLSFVLKIEHLSFIQNNELIPLERMALKFWLRIILLLYL